ncbi:Gfo/Idh/MocA family protein [Mucilaginibacter polytrichastri]|uniref:Uncharacterized protein n=1 Tax=Mucilaginibacter polytrichastri TaxID=1302689 RepID=A0A1Q6A6M0_9SPHI|nr:Gfo/Idh/MocA family oxidoreductase [Mucilaginibacter polytrichastri]OKS89668.1 hypothetical protein RG47T_5153 [Mucilaginibacter polytrichastri]SFT24896.1 Predicted dehydrogenase [Mucilaginibacter polytrichastri]
MKKEKIGVGIIGAGEGSWAVNGHIPALKKLVQEFELVAVSTSNIKSAEATAKKFDIPNAFDNEFDLINHPKVQLVVVAVKVPAHDHLVRTALETGKMVFCEWPLGNGTAEAKALTAIAEEKGIRTFAGLQAHALPELKYLKSIIAEGKIGKVLSSTVTGTGPNWGTSLPNESFAYLLDPKTGANMMTIPFAQTVDGLEFVLGNFKEISALLATRNKSVHIEDSNREVPMLVHDQIMLNGTLKDGTVCSIHYRGGTSPGDNLYWAIKGTKGEIVITSPIGHLQFGKVALQASFDGEPLNTLEIPASYHPKDGGAPGVDADLSRAVYYGYQEIAADIADGTCFFPSFSYAVKRHEFLDKLVESADSGCRKTL